MTLGRMFAIDYIYPYLWLLSVFRLVKFFLQNSQVYFFIPVCMSMWSWKYIYNVLNWISNFLKEIKTRISGLKISIDLKTSIKIKNNFCTLTRSFIHSLIRLTWPLVLPFGIHRYIAYLEGGDPVESLAALLAHVRFLIGRVGGTMQPQLTPVLQPFKTNIVVISSINIQMIKFVYKP